jgi:uncharacterized protein
MYSRNADIRSETEAVLRGIRVLLARARSASPKSDDLEEALFEGRALEVIENAILPPQIAIIGKTGVGKSSTINELFNPQPNLPIDHVEPATIFMEVRQLSLGEDRGSLTIVDCPGLGDSTVADKRNVSSYKEILAKSDVAVWIIKADDRVLGVDQSFVKQVLPKNLKDKLVVGINQIDKIEPGEWIREVNLPSNEQLQSIARKEEAVRKKFEEIGIKPFAIASYSAKKHYRLKRLFKFMLEACPPDRMPALIGSKGEIKSFLSEENDQDTEN